MTGGFWGMLLSLLWSTLLAALMWAGIAAMDYLAPSFHSGAKYGISAALCMGLLLTVSGVFWKGNMVKTIKARDLRAGTKVRIDGVLLTVSDMSFAKDEFFQVGGETSVALDISFHGREPIRTHRDQDIELVSF